MREKEAETAGQDPEAALDGWTATQDLEAALDGWTATQDLGRRYVDEDPENVDIMGEAINERIRAEMMGLREFGTEDAENEGCGEGAGDDEGGVPADDSGSQAAGVPAGLVLHPYGRDRDGDDAGAHQRGAGS